ncbi:MAG: hypothetical protein ACYDGN_10925 [Acidimicrobiales bacterium]
MIGGPVTPAPAARTGAPPRLTSLLGALGELLQPRGGPNATWMVLPSWTRPRLIISQRSKIPAACAVSDYVRFSGRWIRAGAVPLGWWLRSGLPVPLDRRRRIDFDLAQLSAFEEHLDELAPHPVVPAFHLGQERANRKPVLYLLSPRGELIAVAKLATDSLVAELLEQERRGLEWLNSHPVPGVAVPRSIGARPWQGIPIFCQSPLPLRSATVAPALSAVLPAVAAMSHLRVSRTATAASEWWKRIRSSASGDSDEQLSHFLDWIEDNHGQSELDFAPCHGDLAPWNVAGREGVLLIWDWERFELAAPAGVDALHYFFSAVLQSGASPGQAARALFDDTDSTLRACEVPTTHRQLTCLAYVAWIATRYLTESPVTGSRAWRIARALLSEATARSKDSQTRDAR